jgi:hypothetical protein
MDDKLEKRRAYKANWEKTRRKPRRAVNGNAAHAVNGKAAHAVSDYMSEREIQKREHYQAIKTLSFERF